MFSRPLDLKRPGLFVTATGTEVGKTVVTCAIAWHLRRQPAPQERAPGAMVDAGRGRHGCRVGVCKPLATGCRRDREGLVSEDAEALAHFADCRQPLDVISPVRYRRPVAPADAAAQCAVPVDFDAIGDSLRRLDAASDVLLIEGVGGLLVPIDHRDARVTLLDLIRAIAYPVLVVARAGLGTLNHTNMTVRLLQDANCQVAGLIVNGYEADTAGQLDARNDLAMATNRRWLELMSGISVLATVPRCQEKSVSPHHGRIAGPILDAIGACDWTAVLGRSRRSDQ